MKIIATLFLAPLFCTCATVHDNPNAELVMTPGSVIKATTSQGTMQIYYVDRFKRRYVWDDQDKTFRHRARQKRWNGSLGMYRPQGDRTMHAVLEEGQQSFANYSEAEKWLTKQQRFTEHIWTSDGLVVGWKQQKINSRGFMALHVGVWQILIDGKIPELSGASPSQIKKFISQ